MFLLMLACYIQPNNSTDPSVSVRPDDFNSNAQSDVGDTDNEEEASTQEGGEESTTEDIQWLPSGSCALSYAQVYSQSVSEPRLWGFPETSDEVVPVAHPEDAPPYLWQKVSGNSSLVMPGYSDNMPLFERSTSWTEKRCYEFPSGARYLTEEEAYNLYKAIIEHTTGTPIDSGDSVRTVLGLRGAWPGTLYWNGNQPNRFNDTLVVIWRESNRAQVREFHAHTDTGAHNFGEENSSSLRPNRRYRYKNGWHRGYNALQMDEWGYRVQDDSNKNGHWDSDRNGWLNGGAQDYERGGSAHNIHVSAVDGPVTSALVNRTSAGCQTIPGMASWTQFIETVWTELGTEIDYFLVDTRDISHKVWADCTPDGSHECPFEIDGDNFVDNNNTKTGSSEFDVYNCSEANEAGPEQVYLFTTDRSGRISVEVESAEGVDIDLYLLEADDPNACRTRAHISFEEDISPGRYYIVADSWVDGEGYVMSGEYRLHVTFED